MDPLLGILLVGLGLAVGVVLGLLASRWLTRHHELRDVFQAVSSDVLHQNTQQFLELAESRFQTLHATAKGDLELHKKSVEGLVNPIKEQLEKLQQHNRELERARHQAYIGISEQVKHLVSGQEKLASETGRLVTALRAPQVRGRWGEIQLRRVVEMADMLPHCDFVEQESVGSEGGVLRPDLVVRLPGDKQVVVDAKAPLQAYLDAIEATDDTQRETLLRDHARQTRDHLGKLSTKAYWQQFEAAPEFVVMFLPGEAFFSAALSADPSLIEQGVNQRVLMATPTTLIALLRAVAYGWRQERIAEEAENISRLGRDLYERLAVMAEHFGKVGTHLERATKSYNDTVGSLERNVLSAARRFKELGVPSKRDLEVIEPTESTVREVQAKELRPDVGSS